MLVFIKSRCCSSDKWHQLNNIVTYAHFNGEFRFIRMNFHENNLLIASKVTDPSSFVDVSKWVHLSRIYIYIYISGLVFPLGNNVHWVGGNGTVHVCFNKKLLFPTSAKRHHVEESSSSRAKTKSFLKETNHNVQVEG